MTMLLPWLTQWWYSAFKLSLDFLGLTGTITVYCVPGVCSNPSKPCCSDGIMNGDEEGVDCGGSCTTKCPQAPEDKCTNVPDDTCGYEVYGPGEALCGTVGTGATSKEECCQLCVSNPSTPGFCEDLPSDKKCHGFVFTDGVCYLQYSSNVANTCGPVTSVSWFFCTHQCIWVKPVICMHMQSNVYLFILVEA